MTAEGFRRLVPVKGGWGLRGANHLRLRLARVKSIKPALATAWRNTPPQRLIRQIACE